MLSPSHDYEFTLTECHVLVTNALDDPSSQCQFNGDLCLRSCRHAPFCKNAAGFCKSALSLAHLFLINALLGLKVEDDQDGNGHHQGHNVGPPARGGNLQCSGHGSLQFQSFWHCRPCRAASQGGSGCRLTTEHEGRSAKHHKGQRHQEGRKQHKPWSHGCSGDWFRRPCENAVLLEPQSDETQKQCQSESNLMPASWLVVHYRWAV